MEVENRNYCVYIHTSPSGKKYVGQTGVGTEKRWGKNGIGYLAKKKKNGEYTQPAFANAILKYGWDNFQHEIIADNLTKDEADIFEKFLINKLDTMNPKCGYNCVGGGSNGALSEITKRKISESHIGIKPSEESRIKMSESHKGLYDGANHPRARKVCQYDLHGNLINTWECMSEAGRELGISHYNIYSCCQSNRRTCGGFIWRYYEDKITSDYLAWCNEVSPDMHFKKSVSQYSLSGEFICSFESVKEAKLKTGVSYNSISLCCKGKQKTAGGFIWRYCDDEITDEYLSWCNEVSPKSNHKKRVAQYSLSEELIQVFEGVRNAELKTGISNSSICNCCNGKAKTAGGFIWKYHDDAEETA